MGRKKKVAGARKNDTFPQILKDLIIFIVATLLVPGRLYVG